MTAQDLQSYNSLFELFLSGGISAEDFEKRYLNQFKADSRLFPDEIFDVLNKMFSDCDAFNPDPSLRGPADLDERELLAAGRDAYEKLNAIIGRSK